MNPHDYPATVTRIKASYQRDIDLPITLEPTLMERIAFHCMKPGFLIVLAFILSGLVVYSVKGSA